MLSHATILRKRGAVSNWYNFAMSAKLTHAAEILSYYAAGYFPLYDLEDRFYWERLPIRAVIPVTAGNVAKARRLGQRAGKRFQLRRTTAVNEVIGHLQDPRVKSNSWVRSEVVSLYRSLHDAGLLQTVEAYDADSGKLAGALLGLALPGTFIAETMFSLQPDASKVCLCQLLIDAGQAGFQLIDVQTPHDLDDLPPFGAPVYSPEKTPHPCLRLGEITIALPHFLNLFKAAARQTFPGTLSDWLMIASTLALAARQPAQASVCLSHLKPAMLAAAWPKLRGGYSPEKLDALLNLLPH
jgi:leucyl/phenylalanyl-tRNA--protein transferase